MDTDLVLLLLRALGGLLLLAFIGALFFMLWRDYRTVNREISTRTRQRGRLVVLNGNETTITPDMSFPLFPLTSLGRAPTNTIIIDDTFASNEHALVTLRGGQWWLEDQESSNGTMLNDHPVEEPVVLSAGDVIGLGQIRLKIEIE